MNPLEFLRLADMLVRGSTEVEWRTGASRAYYAAFHVARQLLSSCGFRVPRADRAHAYLWLRHSHAGDLDVESAGSDLNGLRGERNAADYNLGLPLLQLAAATQVLVAKEIVRRLAVARREPLRTQITNAMKVYERDILKDVTWHP